MSEVFLSLVIPAYNEEERLSANLKKVLRYLKDKKFSWEVIVVDDYSTDGTAGLVHSVSRENENVRLVENRLMPGKGNAVKTGMLTSRGRYILFTDADLSTPVEELDKFLPLLEDGWQVLIGSRRIEGSKILTRQPLARWLMGMCFKVLRSCLFAPEIADTQCGFKAFSRDAAREIFRRTRIAGFAFDVETVHIAKLLKLKIMEVPVTWSDDPRSRLNILKGPPRMLLELFTIVLNSFLARYH